MAIHAQHTQGWLQDVNQALQEYRSEQSQAETPPRIRDEHSLEHDLQHIEDEFRAAKHHLKNWRTHPAHLWSATQTLEDDGDESCIACEECSNVPYQQEKALHRCKRRLARYDHLKALFQEMVREGNIFDDVQRRKTSINAYVTDTRR